MAWAWTRQTAPNLGRTGSRSIIVVQIRDCFTFLIIISASITHQALYWEVPGFKRGPGLPRTTGEAWSRKTCEEWDLPGKRRRWQLSTDKNGVGVWPNTFTCPWDESSQVCILFPFVSKCGRLKYDCVHKSTPNLFWTSDLPPLKNYGEG